MAVPHPVAAGTEPHPPLPQAGRGKGLPEDTVWRYLIQSLLGLGHIHGKKIIHRDIKALNLFLDAGDNIKVRGNSVRIVCVCT